MSIAGKWCAYEITLICVATLANCVIIYAHSQSAYGARVPRWLLAVTFFADNSVADTLEKDNEHMMPMDTVETTVGFQNLCIYIHLEQHNSSAMPVECEAHAQIT
jgi:hypothetical protein